MEKLTEESTIYDYIGELSRLVALANAYADQETFFYFTLNDSLLTVTRNKGVDTEIKTICICGDLEEAYRLIAWLNSEIVEGLYASLARGSRKGRAV